MDEARLMRIMSGEERGVAGAARLGLGALTPGYRAAVAARNRLFDAGLRKPAHLGRPTISVGNLTTGGTGKTPMVIDLTRRVMALGRRPAVLMRGYASDAFGSDEAREIAAAVPEAVVEPDPSRIAAGRRVLARDVGVGAFVLDDGFQHRQVHRDLDLVLIDATRPFGFGRLLPRGLLREPARNLRRADAVIVTRVDQVTTDELADLDDRIVALTGRPPLAHAAMRWRHVRHHDGELPLETLRPMRVVGVCGIGNPAAFEATLRRHAGDVQAMLAYPDHHDYAVHDWQRMLGTMHATQSEALVMTEKDWVKLHRVAPGTDTVRVLRPVIRVAFTHGEAALDALVRKTVGRRND